MGGGIDGYAFVLKNASGTPLINSRSSVNAVAPGMGIGGSTCPAAGGTYCGSLCQKAIAGETLVGTYNDIANGIFNLNNLPFLSISSVTQPAVIFFKDQSMWDLRTVGSMVAPGFAPYELNDTVNMKSYANTTLFIARNNSIYHIDDINSDMAGLSAYIAKKIDTKYDDGMPYTGNIIAGQNISQMGTGKGMH